MTAHWRQGGKVPHHVYRQRGEQPDRRPFPDGDPPIGMFLDPVDADLAVRGVGALNADRLYEALTQIVDEDELGLRGDMAALAARLAEVLSGGIDI